MPAELRAINCVGSRIGNVAGVARTNLEGGPQAAVGAKQGRASPLGQCGENAPDGAKLKRAARQSD